MKQEREDAQSEIKSLKEQVEELEIDLKQADVSRAGKNCPKKEQLEELEKKLESANNTIEDLENQLQSLDETLSENASLRQMINALQTKISLVEELPQGDISLEEQVKYWKEAFQKESLERAKAEALLGEEKQSHEITKGILTAKDKDAEDAAKSRDEYYRRWLETSPYGKNCQSYSYEQPGYDDEHESRVCLNLVLPGKDGNKETWDMVYFNRDRKSAR